MFLKKKKKKKSKIKIIIIVLIILLLVELSGTTYLFIKRKNNLSDRNSVIKNLNQELENLLIDYQDNIEYGDTWNYEDFYNNLIRDKEVKNLKISVNSIELTNVGYRFMNTGNVIVKFILTKDYKFNLLKTYHEELVVSKDVKLNVVDTKFPIITGVSDKTIMVGDEINLLEGIKAQDDVDLEVDVKIEGEVDVNKVGTYEIKVIAIDKNNNKTEETFKVIVEEDKSNTSQTNQSNNSTNNKPNSSNNNQQTNQSNNQNSSQNNNQTNQSNQNNQNNSQNSNQSSNPNNNQNSNQNSNQNNNSNDNSTKEARLNLAKAEAKKVISKIIKPGMTDYQKAEAICNYLFNNVARQTNQSTEAYKTNFGNEAYAALVLKIAACSGFCKAVTLLCNEAGIQSRHINENQWTHQWNLVYINEEWIVLDSQIGLLGGTKHPLEY